MVDSFILVGRELRLHGIDVILESFVLSFERRMSVFEGMDAFFERFDALFMTVFACYSFL